MRGIKAYRRAAAVSSDPMDLVVALYDGFLRFCYTAKRGIEEGSPAESGMALSKAMDIVSELRISLDPNQDAEFTDRLANIYAYVNQQLLQANLHRDTARIDEVVRLMTELREAWAEAAIKLRLGEADANAEPLDAEQSAEQSAKQPMEAVASAG